MSYLKLMKMMYIAEKTFLLQYGETITGDKMVSMPRGPVLSSVYNLFTSGADYWNNWIQNPGNYDLSLAGRVKVNESDPLDTFDELSVAEKNVLDEVFAKYCNLNRWQLVDLLHQKENCPEWQDPHGSSLQIGLRALLLKNGKSEQETKAIIENLKEVDDLQAVNQALS